MILEGTRHSRVQGARPGLQAGCGSRMAFHNEKVSKTGGRPGASPTDGLGRIPVRPAAISTPLSGGIVYPTARFTRLTTLVT